MSSSHTDLASMRAAWRVAITLANNLCVQISDRHNGNDETEATHVASHCAQVVRGWLEPTDEQLIELLREGGALSDDLVDLGSVSKDTK